MIITLNYNFNLIYMEPLPPKHKIKHLREKNYYVELFNIEI